MKIIFFLISLFFISTAIAQSDTSRTKLNNPEEENISIHLTPYFVDGTFNNKNFDSQFSFRAEIWYPADNNLVIKLFYDQEKSSIMQLNKTGITFSYYFK